MKINPPCRCRRCKWTGLLDDLIIGDNPGGPQCPKCLVADIAVVTPPSSGASAASNPPEMAKPRRAEHRRLTELKMKVSQDWDLPLLRSLAQEQLDSARDHFKRRNLYSACSHLACADALTYLADNIARGQPKDINPNWLTDDV